MIGSDNEFRLRRPLSIDLTFKIFHRLPIILMNFASPVTFAPDCEAKFSKAGMFFSSNISSANFTFCLSMFDGCRAEYVSAGACLTIQSFPELYNLRRSDRDARQVPSSVKFGNTNVLSTSDCESQLFLMHFSRSQNQTENITFCHLHKDV
jgi:hypothetical protein